MPFDSRLLHFFVSDALANYSSSYRIEDRASPVRFLLNGQLYSAHVSYVHDSGNTRKDDETRVQISKEARKIQEQRSALQERVVFLGFTEGGRQFVAWDPTYVLALKAKTVVSVYARESMIDDVDENGFSTYRSRSTILAREIVALALPSELLGFYLENFELLHSLDDDQLNRVIAEYRSSVASQIEDGAIEVETDEGRKKVTYSRKAYPRDPYFSGLVLDAYGEACCVCGKQLGIVQAAHIVPHAEPDCENSVNNGLALCVEHHKLYDDGLLIPTTGARLYVNEDRVAYLVETGRGEGIDEVRQIAARGYRLPKRDADHPSEEFLERGFRIRAGQ